MKEDDLYHFTIHHPSFDHLIPSSYSIEEVRLLKHVQQAHKRGLILLVSLHLTAEVIVRFLINRHLITLLTKKSLTIGVATAPVAVLLGRLYQRQIVKGAALVDLERIRIQIDLVSVLITLRRANEAALTLNKLIR